jgi:hypothetical protein
MKTIIPTQEEAVLLRAMLDTVDPPHDGIDVGTHTELLQHDTAWTRASGEVPGTTREDGSIAAAGQTVQATGFEDESGDVAFPEAVGFAVLDEPGPLALGEKIIAAVGELPGSNRRFSLRFAFRRFGAGR